jgi:hypothetical protein
MSSSKISPSSAVKLLLAPSSTQVAGRQPVAMMLLLDECLPRKFKHPLPGHECQHSFYGWDLTVKLRKHELDVILSGRQGRRRISRGLAGMRRSD